MNQKKFRLAPYQAAAVFNPYKHFAFYAGTGVGKTTTGSHYVIDHLKKYPHLSGFIGANTYDQLSQATLRELMYWLDRYGYEYVIDQRPPASWGKIKKQFKSYGNILSVKNQGQITTVFTRVLSFAHALRGIEFAWYWLDETRDTKEVAHDVVLSRLREAEDECAEGLVTTTTNGEQWDYKRFVLGNDGTGMYGSMHVPTRAAVACGIRSQSYLDTLLATYSPLMAAQECEAEHVNVLGGLAYYAAGDHNRKRRAPWGDQYPNRERPLIIGCDFNFQPAPCVWMVGQTGPDEWDDRIHWFGEIAEPGVSSVQMTLNLIGRYPGFFYRIFGDVSGNQGTTSNAGQTDYDQISMTLDEQSCLFSIDVDQGINSKLGQNPIVKNRVENMNAKFKNAMGEVTQTYNPDTCPLFDGDCKLVGWKPTVMRGRGKLDDGGDNQRTHATDGGGYAVWKLFPPGRRAQAGFGTESAVRKSLGGVL